MSEHTLEELAGLTQSQLIGPPDHIVNNVADLVSATPEDVSFLANPRYSQAMIGSKAGAIFIAPNVPLPPNRSFLIHPNPSEAFQMAIKIFHGDKLIISDYTDIHATAVIHPTADIGDNVTIGPHAVIDKDAKIGPGSIVCAGCYIGPGAIIGSDCILHPHAIVREFCRLGDRVVLQPGAVIGSCGFGFIQDAQGRHKKLEQLGYVEIGDDVEVGANATIDRARFKKTTIGRGTKIDNLVQIAHGVEIGEDSLIIAQTGIAGSTTIGNNVILAGQVAVAGHIKIADKVVVAGRSGITKSLDKAGRYGGLPAIPLNEYNRNLVKLRNIDAYISKMQELENRLDKLTENRS